MITRKPHPLPPARLPPQRARSRRQIAARSDPHSFRSRPLNLLVRHPVRRICYLSMPAAATHRADIRPGLPADIAAARMLDQFGPMLFNLAMRLCGSREDAEDLVQETMLQAYRKWPQFEGRSNAKTWIYSIACRTCKRLHRRRAGQPSRIASLDRLLPVQEIGVRRRHEKAHAPQSREQVETVQAAVLDLPLHYRLALVLKDVVGLTVPEVCHALGLKEGTVKARVHRARLQLRQALASRLPAPKGAGRAFSLQVCIDLLHAKQEALDRGARFPDREVICDHCRSVFATLDLAQDLCNQLAEGQMPRQVRNRITSQLALSH